VCYNTPVPYHRPSVFGPFTATPDGDTMTFEQFLLESKNRSSNLDPGYAMIAVLKEKRIPGIDISEIENSWSLNPIGNPGNILPFLCHIAERGSWGVNMEVVVD